MKLIDLVNFVILFRHSFSIWNELTQMVNFPTWIPDCDSHSLAFLDLFISYLLLTSVYVLQWHFLYIEIWVMLFSQFPLTFLQIQKGMPLFSLWLFSFGFAWVCVIMQEMFHWQIFVNPVLLLLNIVESGSWLELMYVSLTLNMRLSLIYLHDFRLLVQLQ